MIHSTFKLTEGPGIELATAVLLADAEEAAADLLADPEPLASPDALNWEPVD
jgi:hypothetical protein